MASRRTEEQLARKPMSVDSPVEPGMPTRAERRLAEPGGTPPPTLAVGGSMAAGKGRTRHKVVARRAR